MYMYIQKLCLYSNKSVCHIVPYLYIVAYKRTLNLNVWGNPRGIRPEGNCTVMLAFVTSSSEEREAFSSLNPYRTVTESIKNKSMKIKDEEFDIVIDYLARFISQGTNILVIFDNDVVAMGQRRYGLTMLR